MGNLPCGEGGEGACSSSKGPNLTGSTAVSLADSDTVTESKMREAAECTAFYAVTEVYDPCIASNLVKILASRTNDARE